MEVAKVTSKGQITIPISIRRKLEINEGDKVLFVYKTDGVMMVNPNTFQGGSLDDSAESEVAAKGASPKKKTAVAPPVAAAETAVDGEPDTTRESRPVPPPVDEPEKPDTHVGGFNLSTLLDDIRSIGSNI